MEDGKNMEEFMNQIDDSMRKIDKGDIVEGTVLTINADDVVVNIGHVSDGIIPKNEILDQSDLADEDKIKVGDVLSLYVMNPHDKEGNIVLSQKRAVEATAREELRKSFEEHTTINVKVKEVVKGGVIAFYKNVRCFIPASLLALRYVEDLSVFVGQELEVMIEDLDLEKKRIVLSRKAVEKEEREKKKADILENIEIGKKYNGTITKLMKYGAFVDIGGVEGLVHISDLSWNRIKHPSEVVSEGQQVEVVVLNYDAKTGKIGLGLKKVEDDPWNNINYRAGDVLEGKVVRLADFGAFVELENGIEGLVHVSEISSEHVHRPEDALKEGQKVNVKVLKVDTENNRISLSIKEAEGKAEEEERYLSNEEEGTTLGDIFGDKLKNFFK